MTDHASQNRNAMVSDNSRYVSSTPEVVSGNEPLTGSILTDFAELESFAPDWRHLQHHSGNIEIFQHFGWIQSWWQYLRGDGQLRTPIVRRGARCVAILPLVLEERRLRFLAHSASDYNHFLAEPAESRSALRICFDLLLAQKAEWDELRLDNVPESSLMMECIDSLPKGWRRWLVKSGRNACPTIVFGENRIAVLKSLVSKESLKRSVRRMKRHGVLAFRHLDEPGEAERHLDEFIRQHVRRSAIAGRRSNFRKDGYAAFYADLLRRLDVRSEIRFSVLTLDGRPIAYHFGTLFGSKYLWYKPAFDVDFWELSPGQTLLWYLLDSLRSIDVQEFDFGLGDEAFKFRFNNAVHFNRDIAIFVPGLGSYLRKWKMGLSTLFKDLLRRVPSIDRYFHLIVANLGRLGEQLEKEGIGSVLATFWRERVFQSESSWVIKATISDAKAMRDSNVVLRQTTLGELADLSLEMPGILTAEKLTEARQVLREGATIWVLLDGKVPRALLPVVIGDAFRIANKTLPLAEKAMIASQIWVLVQNQSTFDLDAVLCAFAAVANAQNLSAWVVCPAWPNALYGKSKPIKPQYRTQRTKIMGNIVSERLLPQ